MIISIREYPEDLTAEAAAAAAATNRHPSDAEQQQQAQNFQYEYIVDMTTVIQTTKNRIKPVVFKRKGPALLHQTQNDSAWNNIHIFNRLQKIFADLFLPLGYPHSVHDASYYWTYQLYDGLQGLCSYWRGVVATRAVLEAAGVGNAEATAASAAVQWALRDGTGMVGGLVFAHSAAPHLDTHVKEFRLLADVVNDIALTLDMLAPYVSGVNEQLCLLSLSTIGKTVCGISAGATKGRITQHFSASHNNMADLSAKESTQETLVSLLGMIGGVAVAHLLQYVAYVWTWILFGGLTLLHLWANYKGVKLLKLATLNPERTAEIFQTILPILLPLPTVENTTTTTKEDQQLAFQQQALKDSLPTPRDIDESLASSTMNLLFPSIHVNHDVIDPRHFEFARVFAKEKYLIGRAARGNDLFIYLGLGATSRDELIAYLHALLLQEIVNSSSSNDSKAMSPITIDAKLMKE
jgi:hypothetical protein